MSIKHNHFYIKDKDWLVANHDKKRKISYRMLLLVVLFRQFRGSQFDKYASETKQKQKHPETKPDKKENRNRIQLGSNQCRFFMTEYKINKKYAYI